MKIGAVIFAQNNSAVDYIKMACYTGRRLTEFLGIPVSLITDNKEYLETQHPDHPFEHVIEITTAPATRRKFYDGTLSSKLLDWNNVSRHRIYDLSPYDRTLVIDSDYVINSTVLKTALENPSDFQIYRKSVDLADWRDQSNVIRINQYSIPFYWATVFIFDKNPIIEAFFDLITYIKANWTYFRILYSIESGMFRNDFAFSIAIHIMNGKTNGQFATELPGKTFYLSDKDVLVRIDGNKIKALVEKKEHLGEYIAVKSTGVDVHVMNKASLNRWIDEETK